MIERKEEIGTRFKWLLALKKSPPRFGFKIFAMDFKSLVMTKAHYASVGCKQYDFSSACVKK